MFGVFSFYSCIIIILTIISILQLSQHTISGKNFYFHLGCFLLLYFAMCRGESVGGDLESYLPLFQSSRTYDSFAEIFKIPLFTGYEIGFLTLCKAISLISFDNRAFIAVTAFLSLIGPFFVISKYATNKGLSLLLFVLLGFYNFTFNSVRQAIAISIVMFAIHYLIQNKKWRFFIGVILAVSIHTSAFFALLFYPMTLLRYSFKKILYLLCFFAVVFFIFGRMLFELLLSNVFVRYLDATGDAYTVSGTGYGLLTVYVFVALLCLFLFQEVKNNMDSESQRFSVFFLLSVIFAVVIQAFSSYMVAITRLTNFFYLLVIVLLPNLIGKITEIPIRRVSVILVYFMFYVFACYTFLAPVGNNGVNATDTIPYVFLDGMFVW